MYGKEEQNHKCSLQRNLVNREDSVATTTVQIGFFSPGQSASNNFRETNFVNSFIGKTV